MSATIGAAAITAGAGLLGSLFGAKNKTKTLKPNVIGKRKCILWIENIILLQISVSVLKKLVSILICW